MDLFVPDGPLTVGWDITNACNLRCKHCYSSAGKRYANEFDLSEIRNIVDELSQLGTVLVVLAGGEPLLRADLVDIVSYIKCKGIEVFLNTNATLITPNRAVDLVNAGLRHIEVSVDGLQADHDAIRGKGAFERAMRGFRACQDAGLQVGIMSTLLMPNINHIPEIVDYFHKQGAIGIGFLRFIPTGRGSSNQQLCISPQETKKAIEDVYRKRMQYGDGFHLKVETPVSILVAEDYPELLKEHAYINFMNRGCDGGIISCQILADGTVTFCAQMRVGQYNLHEHSMKFIWDNDHFFQRLRTRMFAGKCGRCRLSESCGGCRVDAFLETGDVLGGDPGCWLE